MLNPSHSIFVYIFFITLKLLYCVVRNYRDTRVWLILCFSLGRVSASPKIQKAAVEATPDIVTSVKLKFHKTQTFHRKSKLDAAHPLLKCYANEKVIAKAETDKRRYTKPVGKTVLQQSENLYKNTLIVGNVNKYVVL